MLGYPDEWYLDNYVDLAFGGKSASNLASLSAVDPLPSAPSSAFKVLRGRRVPAGTVFERDGYDQWGRLAGLRLVVEVDDVARAKLQPSGTQDAGGGNSLSPSPRGSAGTQE